MSFLIPIALIILGLVLLGVELHVTPGATVFGVLGVISIGVGVVIAFMTVGLIGGILSLSGALLAAGGLIWYLWQTGAWDRLILADVLGHDDPAEIAERESRSRWLGEVGTAVTPLRPTGIVEIGGERIEVLTEGAFVAVGSRVKVVAMDRRRYFVRLAEEDEKLGAPDEAA